MKSKMTRLIVGLLVLAISAVSAKPSLAQPGRRPPHHHHHHHHRGPSDFDKALGVIGVVGVAAAVAHGYSAYHHRRAHPVVVVPPTRTVVVESPVIVERPVVVEKHVVVEKTAPAPLPTDYYSSKLGATFKIQNMQIPGYRFTAARLTSDPLEGSPLEALGLVKGDVVTRLNDTPAARLEVLEMYEKATLVRYIKTGTVKVRMGRIYIPTDAELAPVDEDGYHAP